ncbi:enoyl-CoA hydratase/isomerase family protein [Streptomyces piniterrae]|uniref:Enoyl-CoA hydratase/isomerase family protein n=1 Tax=Streptomyces piniterrae TaxID=2571125 RepID=A0A4U0NWV7_9ACTN|nr:enoyl-CoA hydratase/isomerase family protein [Streptomyces piniterrae]TJZ59213.1 enoyl-CoA hydratase/isomerase family protein [Streptomyces piniterrae]
MVEDFKALHVIPEGPVLKVQLNSPETGNAISGLLLDELLAVLGALQDESGVRVLILSGAGDDFSLGGDRREFSEILAADSGGAELRVLAAKARRVCDALATLNVVTIARLHGGVIGAGMALALFCDLRAGADNCRFRMPELALGMPPAWGGALPRLLNETGAARIRELVLTGDSFDAAKAAELSILHKVVPEEKLDDAIRLWTRPLVRRSPAALRTAKVMMNAYAGANRLADATLFDAELMTSVLAAAESARRR